jgi:hypothetical protein
MHRVGVSAPDIAGADTSNLPALESFRSQWPILNLRVAQKKRPQRGGRAETVQLGSARGGERTRLLQVAAPSIGSKQTVLICQRECPN